MKRISGLFLTAALILIIAGCSTPPVKKGFVKYEMKAFEKSVGDTTSKGGAFGKATLKFPVITDATDKSTLDILNGFIRDQVLTALFREGRYKTPEFFIEGFLTEYTKAVGENPSGASNTWTIDRSVEITFLNDKVICFLFYESSFLGGAHPNTNLFYSVFDVVSGRKLGPGDFFIEGYEDKLTQIAEKKFREIRELKPGENLGDAGFWFGDNKFLLNKNFGLTKEGVVFFYNAYEVAPYALGSTGVVLNYKDIKELLKKEFLFLTEK